ncbi:inositol phosphorylceramide synthase [Clostridium sp. P21]|uniref:Inositol phosphorylceramide synthase n=1 Tax=Clostridium muellerianum TaxID=2716538 RepID=A0A7Y0EKZ5_9CLOT|nr:phosphatase PAP2 family protein [Clostridium muellerianum]NMM65381.1 inositol phosphorylceramide synthase [Clostridium muellerianum]
MLNLNIKSTSGIAHNLLSKALDLLNRYYFILIGLYFLKKAIGVALHSHSGVDYKAYLFLLAFASFTTYSELRKDVKWIPFLILCIPFLMFISYINVHGYEFWGKMLSWQISRSIVVDLNPIFSKIPFNDAAFARVYKPETLTWILRMVYNNGFVLPVLLPLYRAAISKDFKKMIRYALSGHVLQVFLITPFYLTFHLQEVWFVLGQPDGLARHFSSPAQAAGTALNCFPSMHTSIAFAMFLLVMREKNKLFKYLWGFFCLSVVFSTMYLEIHWVIDVLAGMLLAYCTVKLVDFILDKGKSLIQAPLSSIYYRTIHSTYLSDYNFRSLQR